MNYLFESFKQKADSKIEDLLKKMSGIKLVWKEKKYRRGVITSRVF